MNITPTLPNPQQLPPEQERRAVAAVQPTRRTRDATDGVQYRQVVRDPEMLERAVRGAGVGSSHQAIPERSPGRAGRALAAYAEVADDTDRSELRRVLGFDAYA
jgi:hypothetical protein